MLTKLSKTEENSVIKEARVLFQKCAPGGNVAKIFLRLVCFVKLYFVECYYQTQLFEPCLRRMDSAAFRNFQNRQECETLQRRRRRDNDSMAFKKAQGCPGDGRVDGIGDDLNYIDDEGDLQDWSQSHEKELL